MGRKERLRALNSETYEDFTRARLYGNVSWTVNFELPLALRLDRDDLFVFTDCTIKHHTCDYINNRSYDS
jgi:hypothetical protein